MDVPAALVVFVAAFVLNILQFFLHDLKVARSRREQALLEAEISHLKRQAAAMSSPQTFSQSAKLQRKAVAYEKDRELLQTEQEQFQRSWAFTAPSVGRWLAMALVLYLYWGRPVVMQEPGALWPLGRWLAMPHGSKLGGSGAIAVLPWLAVCQRVASMMTQPWLKRWLPGGGQPMRPQSSEYPRDKKTA